MVVQGKLVYRTSKTHDIWKIASPGGDLVYKLPGQPLDVTGEKIPVGSILALVGNPWVVTWAVL